MGETPLVFENAGPLSSLGPKTKARVMLPEVRGPKCVYARVVER
jgi:hypothetical protein